MKILHVIPKLPINTRNTVIGGSANAVIHLARQQRQVGDDVTLLSHFPLLKKTDAVFMRENGFKNIHMLSRQNSRLYGAEFTLKAVAASLPDRGACDIIHGHSGHIDYLLASRLIAGPRLERLVYSLYCPLNLDSTITRYPLRKEYLEAVSKDVTFIAISQNIANSLEPLAKKKNVVVIPLPVDTERFTNKFDKDSLRRKYSFDTKAPVLLFVGNFSQTKNMECVLIAFKRFLAKHPEARLIVTTELHIARFSERELYLQRLIDDLGISEKLIFPGVTDDMPQLMQLSDVLIAPFRDSDGPSDYYLAALEAMSVGTPVFVSPRGGMKEVIDGENGWFIDPEQPEQVFSELERFFAHPAAGMEMGVEAARYIRRNFSPSLVEQKVKEVYLEVLKHAK